MKGRPIKYSDEEMAWLEENRAMVISDYHRAFVERFGRRDVSLQNLHSLRKRKGWKTGRTGRFKRGQEPHNKGKEMSPETRAKVSRAWFKKGQLPHNHKDAGHEMVCPKDGYVYLIVAETNPHTGADTNRVLKHKYLWEQANGPLPDGHCLKCLDGDKTNTDPSNWEAIPRALLPRLSGGRWYKPYDAYEPEARPLVLSIAKLEHTARMARKGGET